MQTESLNKIAANEWYETLATLQQAGVTSADLKMLRKNDTHALNFKAWCDSGCLAIKSHESVPHLVVPEGEDLVRYVLGNDYLSVSDMVKASCSECNKSFWAYNDAQLAGFAGTLPTDSRTLHWIKENNLVLIPGPAHTLKISDLYFPRDTSKRTKQMLESFDVRREDSVQPAVWMAVGKDCFPGSLGKTWKEQFILLPKDLKIPNIAELFYSDLVLTVIHRRSLIHNSALLRSSSQYGNAHVQLGEDHGGPSHIFHLNDENDKFNLGMSYMWRQ